LKYILTISLLFSCVLAFAQEKIILPGAVYLNGVGEVYGVGAGLKKTTGHYFDLFAAKSLGKVDGEGVIVSNIPIFDPKIKLSLGHGQLNKADYETSYSRGLSQGYVVRQQIKGKGSFIGVKLNPFDEKLTFTINYINSWVRFIDYTTTDGQLIPFAKRTLHDISSDIKTYSTSYNFYPHSVHGQRASKIKGSVTTIKGRIAQSNLAILALAANNTFPIGPNFQVSLFTDFQTTKVTDESNSSAVDGDCDTLTNATDKQRCEQLEQELTNFVAESNRHGTSSPLGGSKKLRSYREMRFKGAHTLLNAVEFEMKILKKRPLSAIVFGELGQVSDQFSDLLKHSRYSAGLGLRYNLGAIPLRLESATGSEGQTVYLTAGYPW